MKKELERILTDKLAELRSNKDEISIAKVKHIEVQVVKIADIAFAFNNAELIKLLRVRGQHIMYQNYDKMREVEKEISILKEAKYDDLTTPVDAFITFEAEDGFIMAMEFEERKNGSINETKIFMNIPLVLDDAPEPTNIIWENRHLSDEDYLKRGLQVFAIVIFLLAVSFTTIFLCKNF